MKKSLLKCGFVLLIIFFFCASAMSQNCNDTNLFPSVLVGPIADCDGGSDFQGLFYRDDNGDYYYDELTPCLTKDNSQLGLCRYTDTPPFSIGSGTLLLMFFVLGYGGILYYRRRQIV